MFILPWAVVSILLLSHILEAYKVLVIVPIPCKSHSILGHSLVKLIAEAGNEVTYITSFPQKNPPTGVKEISVLEENHKKIWKDGLNLTAALDREVTFDSRKNFIKLLNDINLQIIQNKEVQILMNDPNEKFDVIIAQWMFGDIYAGLAPIFDCPLIWFSTMEKNADILWLIGELPNPAYSGDITSKYLPPFTFWQRVLELKILVSNLLLEYFYASPLQNAQYEKIIAPIILKRVKTAPDFNALRHNASLVLGNSHVSLGSATSLPVNYKPVAGYHISKNVELLTGDLKNLFDNSKHGVIYFSLGSNLKSESFPNDLKDSLLKMFGGLNQTVLWKLEDDIPYKPKNVHIVQWAQQQSILAHKNCILFITHGGYLSMIESIHFGKPLIGIPVYGDQFGNVARAVQKGFAKKIDLSYEMADKVREAIQEILTNPSYAAKAKEFSFNYFHRPVSPAVELVHWVDHVVQTRGAMYLRSPALEVYWYQKFYMDLVLVLLLTMFGLKILVTRICFIMRKKEENKKKKN